MEQCIWCESSDLSRVRPYRAHTEIGQKVFGGSWLVRCGECRLVQASPCPSEDALNAYYTHDYRDEKKKKIAGSGTDVADASTFPKDNLYYYNRGRSIAELLSGYVTAEEPVMADLGAGYGHICHAFGERYPESTRFAIEPSEACAVFLDSIGVEVVRELVEEGLPKVDQELDVVVLCHTLEHLREPRKVMELIASKLAPGGLLYVEIPNIPDWSFDRHLVHKWAPRYDEPHVTFYSPDVLSELMGSIFSEKFCDTSGPEYEEVSALRFRLPALKPMVLGMMPPSVFELLRKSSLTKGARVQSREEAFYQYGGERLWIRSVWQRNGDT